MTNRLSVIVIVMAVGLATARPAHADQHFKAILTGAQQVGGWAFDPARAIGTVDLNAAETQITVNLTFRDLFTGANGLHIHGPAAVGASGAVVFDLSAALPLMTSGTIPPQVIPVSPAQVAELKANQYYFDLHVFGEVVAELRGQILPAPPERFSAKLSGAQEVPPVAGAGKGVGTVLLNADESKISVDVDFSALSSNANGGHIHGPAAPGANAPILFDFTSVLPAATSGTVPTQVFSVTAGQVAQLRAGQFYINIHTGTNPGGEIRGQIEPAPRELYTATLNGNQQVPTVSSPGFGTGSVLLNRAENLITVNLSFSGLTSAANAAHIHGPATAGANAGVLFDFSSDVAGLTSGGITERTFAITPSQVTQLRAGQFYFNIHTGTFGGGEIRGQILLAPAQRYSGTMVGAQMVPPVSASGNGFASIVLNATEDQIDAGAYFDFFPTTVTTDADIHGPAASGANAPPFLSFITAATSTGAGADQSFAITQGRVAELKALQHYAVVHTAAYPDGEIRGQLENLPMVRVNRGGTGSAAGDTTSAPSGITCGGDCAESYPRFTQLYLTAGAAAAGSVFSGWFGSGCSGTGPCYISTPDTLTTVTAVYTLVASPITFTDNPMAAGVTVKAVHITELRSVVNSMRATHGLPAFTFTDPALAAGNIVKAVHITDLRLALTQIYSQRGWQVPSFTESIAPGSTIKALHIHELRMAVRLLE